MVISSEDKDCAAFQEAIEQMLGPISARRFDLAVA